MIAMLAISKTNVTLQLLHHSKALQKWIFLILTVVLKREVTGQGFKYVAMKFREKGDFFFNLTETRSDIKN
jgi:hypothetical protein